MSRMVRLPGKAPAPTRKIMSFDPKPGSKVDPMSQGAPKWADQLRPSDDKNPPSDGKIDPRQMRY
jgi:hypothetical protein